MLKKIAAAVLSLLFVCSLFPLGAFAEESETNLAAGLTYSISTGTPIEYSYLNYSVNGEIFEQNHGQLTDSVLGGKDSQSENWYRAYRGGSRVVNFDLGAICAVSRVESGFFHSKVGNILAPRQINVYLSVDGENFELVSEYKTEFLQGETSKIRCDAVILLDQVYSARYVCVEYFVDDISYCDEIKIIGTKTLSGNEVEPKGKVLESHGGYLGSVGGLSDIVKLYNGYNPDDPSKGVLTSAELLPYVAYLDANGVIAGEMFDAIILLPINCDYPSGGRLVKTSGKMGAVMSDWELYLDHTFTPGQDLDALDKVVGNVYSALSKNGKFNVFLSIPYPTVLANAFGDINGDGVGDYCRTLDERLAITKWYIDQCIERFNAHNYKNLNLSGFCWARDEIDFSDTDHEQQLIAAVNNYISSTGKASLFSGAYLSSGFADWADLGFESAVMQSDAAEYVLGENGYFEIQTLSEFAHALYNNNLGAEIETADNALFESDYKLGGYNYESHLYYGSVNGYMNGLNVYSQAVGPGLFYDFCYADISTPKGIYLRRLYDITHRYINGNYLNMPPKAEIDTDWRLLFGDTKISMDLNITDIDSHWENISVEFVTLPQHGAVTVTANKNNIIYNADSDFVGTDSFVLKVGDGFEYAENITVNITVYTPADSSDVIEDTESLVPPPIRIKTETIPIWLVVLLFVLGGFMIAVAVVTIVKPIKDKEK